MQAVEAVGPERAEGVQQVWGRRLKQRAQDGKTAVKVGSEYGA